MQQQRDVPLQALVARGVRAAEHVVVVQLDPAMIVMEDDSDAAERPFAHVQQLVAARQLQARQRSRRRDDERGDRRHGRRHDHPAHAAARAARGDRRHEHGARAEHAHRHPESRGRREREERGERAGDRARRVRAEDRPGGRSAVRLDAALFLQERGQHESEQQAWRQEDRSRQPREMRLREERCPLQILQVGHAYEQRGQQHHPHAGARPAGRGERTRRDPALKRPSREDGAAGEAREKDGDHGRERVDGILVDEREGARRQCFQRQRDRARRRGQRQRFPRRPARLDLLRRSRSGRIDRNRPVDAVEHERARGDEEIDGDRRDERSRHAEGRQQPRRHRQRAGAGATGVRGVETAGPFAQRLRPRRDELRQHRQRSAHGGRRNQHRDDRDGHPHAEMQRGAVAGRVLDPGQDRLHGAQQRVHGERGQTDDDLQSGEDAKRPGEARREPAEQVAAETEPGKERRERGRRGGRRGAEEHREAPHPQDFVGERGGAREKEQRGERGRAAALDGRYTISGRPTAQGTPVR